MSHKVSVSLNDGAVVGDPASSGPPPPDSNGQRAERDTVAAALDELTGWRAQDRHSMFRRWHQGALSLVHLNVLAALDADGPLSMSRLAETLDVSVASATGIVDRMERRGLVERRHDTEDRRVVLVQMAPAGADISSELDSRRREHLARLLRELSDEDLAALLRGARALRAARARLAERTAADCPPDQQTDGGDGR